VSGQHERFKRVPPTSLGQQSSTIRALCKTLEHWVLGRRTVEPHLLAEDGSVVLYRCKRCGLPLPGIRPASDPAPP
jgi:hypothetical protein